MVKVFGIALVLGASLVGCGRQQGIGANAQDVDQRLFGSYQESVTVGPTKPLNAMMQVQVTETKVLVIAKDKVTVTNKCVAKITPSPALAAALPGLGIGPSRFAAINPAFLTKEFPISVAATSPAKISKQQIEILAPSKDEKDMKSADANLAGIRCIAEMPKSSLEYAIQPQGNSHKLSLKSAGTRNSRELNPIK